MKAYVTRPVFDEAVERLRREVDVELNVEDRILSKKELIERLSREQPTNWRLPREIAVENYAEAWADEILPIARQAHERLEFSNVHAELDQDRYVSVGIAQERIVPDRIVYADWAANVVREELHKAGWRLADLLEKTVARGAAP